MKKKILLLSPYFPFPPRDGGKVRMFNLIKHLSEGNDLYFLSYIENEEMRSRVPELEKYCRRVYTVLRDESRRITGPDVPRSPAFFYTQAMIDELGRVMEEVRPDIVQIDFLVMTQYVKHLNGATVVYTEHDISNINFEQSFHDRDLPEKQRFVEWTRLLEFEKEILRKFHSVIVLTERDERILREFSPGVRSVLIPTGVDVDYYRPAAAAAQGNSLLYVGHYRHYPNFDAMAYFVREIFPAIRERVPGATLNIVGSGVYGELLKLEGDGVHVVGEVEDVRSHLQQATVFVAPVRLGGGIKGKILEAMACGVPVVATGEASQGIRCVPGEDLLVAADEADFAAKTAGLLEDAARRVAIARRARATVEEQYDWKKIARKMNEYYDSLLS